VLVEVRGFEPLTPWLQTMCSAKLSYTPDKQSEISDLKFEISKEVGCGGGI
jgi:hypothetical protein